ncbi:hypothetical protein OSSY52_12790 [Tepiditoga spiralis]|uniref:Small ribosomal subunit protein bS6 n=1 Tax=Tepiditoga spiralis TaxID=2108365 RepID=A0A7G1G3W0_9BACT|nr:30S ribosomal protein S6 [Tepiditoga spiralis]BBE31138.1 hypothetical protein OSSY52_12790 [Tepiditoga spiralis]
MAKARYYETMIIVRPDLAEEARNEVVDKVKGWIEEKVGGTIETAERWGMRKLAYRTQKTNFTEGDYAYFIYKGEPEKVNVLDDLFHITAEVFRHQTFRREDLEKKAKKKESNITVEAPVTSEESAE